MTIWNVSSSTASRFAHICLLATSFISAQAEAKTTENIKTDVLLLHALRH